MSRLWQKKPLINTSCSPQEDAIAAQGNTGSNPPNSIRRRTMRGNNPCHMRPVTFAIIRPVGRVFAIGGGPRDEATHSAIADARAKGTLVIVAAGNDGRQPVSFPAADSLSLAVSALGRQGTFPDGTTELGDVAPPFGKDKKNFIAAFSNIGPELVLTGPGVGIISTFPGDKYAVLDGTSMACPAVTGAAAKLLSTQPALLANPRDQTRSDTMAKAVLQAANTLGFPATLEGQGLIPI